VQDQVGHDANADVASAQHAYSLEFHIKKLQSGEIAAA
jgi:hypothetical protein